MKKYNVKDVKDIIEEFNKKFRDRYSHYELVVVQYYTLEYPNVSTQSFNILGTYNHEELYTSNTQGRTRINSIKSTHLNIYIKNKRDEKLYIVNSLETSNIRIFRGGKSFKRYRAKAVKMMNDHFSKCVIEDLYSCRSVYDRTAYVAKFKDGTTSPVFYDINSFILNKSFENNPIIKIEHKHIFNHYIVQNGKETRI